MKPSISALALILFVLSACKAERAAQDESGSTAEPTLPPAGQPVGQSAEDVPPATAAQPTPAGTPVPGTYQGYGKARFGMSADEVKRDWQGELVGAPSEGSRCHYLRPKQADGQGWPALMFEDGKFVRYDVGTIAGVAPGGGQVGMSIDDIRAAYGRRIQELPHKYVEGGRNLRIKSGNGASAIVFEADAAGRITSWRVGVPPQVDYVEGCS